MKVWCADVVRAIARTRLTADNATLREHNGVLSAIPELPSMFTVDKTGPDSISVRAGVASRYDGAAGSASTYEMTIVGGGTSGSPLDGVELTSLAASQWIILTLDETAGTLVASGTGDLGIPDSYGGTLIPIALVIMDGGDIVRILQTHTGPWYLPIPVNPDAKSIARNASSELEIKGWDNASNSAMELTDAMLVPVHTGETPTPILIYKNFLDIAAWMGYATGGGLYGPGNPPPLTDHTHGEHTAYYTDDHDQASGVPLLRLDGVGDEARNAMAGAIGDASGNRSVLPDSRQLWGFYGGNLEPIIDWAALKTMTPWTHESSLGVTLRTTTNDLTVTHAAVTVGGNVYTPISIDVEKADGSGIVTMEVLAKVTV